MADEDRIIPISVDELQANPLQPRGVITPESLVDLVDSIREHGILEPLVVAKTPAGYQIIAGERRWRAAKIVGLKDVPVIIKETSPRGMLEMAIVENVQRVDLNPIERARAFQRLVDEFVLPTSEIAKRIGKSQSYVSNSLRLLTLPDAIKDGILSGIITEGHARALAQIDDNRLMIEAYKIVLRESASVRRAEEISRRIQNVPRGEVKQKAEDYVNNETDRMQQEMEQALKNIDNGSNWSHIKIRRSRNSTMIIFVLKGLPEETEPRFQHIYKSICK